VFPTNYKPHDYSPRINATCAILLQKSQNIRDCYYYSWDVNTRSYVVRKNNVRHLVKTIINYCINVLTLLFSDLCVKESNDNEFVDWKKLICHRNFVFRCKIKQISSCEQYADETKQGRFIIILLQFVNTSLVFIFVTLTLIQDVFIIG